MRSKATSQNKAIIRIIKTPITVLCKAKDLYVKGITNFSTTYSRPMMMIKEAAAAPTAHVLPRSLSTTMLSDNDGREDLMRALIRANSTSTARSSMSTGTVTQISIADLESYTLPNKRQEESISSTNAKRSSLGTRKVPRSCSVVMGRIDEERVSSFRDDNNIARTSKLVINDDRDSTFSSSRSNSRASSIKRRLNSFKNH